MAGSWNDSSSASFHDLEAFDCPVCCDALTAPILQCDNGHIVCFTCCIKLRNKCPSCTLPIGHSHEKECVYSPCSCPWRSCDYTGSYMGLFKHYPIHVGQKRYRYQFRFGEFADIHFDISEYDSVVMEEYGYGRLFVVQCFKKPHGVCVTVSCIAPCAKEVGEFSCCISTLGKYNMRIELPKVKKIRKLMSSETPKEDFLLVPSYMFCGLQSLKLRVCVSKVEAR